MIKKQFTLYLENKPGRLADVTRKLAAAKVNIEGISVAVSADVGLVQIVVDDAAHAKRVLNQARIPFTIQNVALVPLRNEPGALCKLATRLSTSKVNINYVYATTCNCDKGCDSYVVISAPDLDKVEKAWQSL